MAKRSVSLQLSGEIYGSEKTIDEVVTEWIARFAENESNSVADIVNFVLKCSGCDLKIDQHDIEDPDACTSKLSDIQDEYQAVRPPRTNNKISVLIRP